MRICVIFNPVAQGEKARRFRRRLDEIAPHCGLKLSQCAGDARALAAEAVQEGWETVVAAGGDGTVNEVLNGLGDVADGFDRACLAVLPLGTANVFARELGIPPRFEDAWNLIRRGQSMRIDLPRVIHRREGREACRYFAQLGGAGLDARAIELVNWRLKRKAGPLAYVVAGLRGLLEARPPITVEAGGRSATGGLVLIGNGRLYGGAYQVFPQAELRDGLLDVCVFPRVGWLTLARCGPELLLRKTLPGAVVQRMRGETVRLSSAAQVPFEVDGELAGVLPATFSVQPSSLRVIAP